MTPVTEFYAGRTLLVTGGTGFMGKVLLEKLIRSLPDIKKIYVLLRPKKGLAASQRLEEMVNKWPFTLLDIPASNFEKLEAINGDTSKKDLGLSIDDRQKLLNEVSIVFHLAASIRMNLNLKEAVLQNTISTLSVLKLCAEMANLVCVMHLSTAYCNIGISHMKEEVYEPEVDPYKIINLVEWMDDSLLKMVENDLIHPHPNTYTFTKRLAEYIAWDIGKNVPVVICRPSIVVPSSREPVPGWIDNYNGAAGIMAAGKKGIIRTALVDPNCEAQIIPVDIAINILILSAWYRATNKFNDTPVFNVTQGDIVKVTWNDIIEKLRIYAVKYPPKIFLWYPLTKLTPNKWLHYFTVILFHMMPAYLIDFLLIIFRQKTFLVDVQKRLNIGMQLLGYFATKSWTFDNKNGLNLLNILGPEDTETFHIIKGKFNVDKYMRDAYFGSTKFLFKEDTENLTVQRIVHKIMLFLEYTGRVLLIYGLLWCILYLFSATHLISWRYWSSST